jgi:tRNA G18 (ribose-2'-O)-methylase SpoU
MLNLIPIQSLDAPELKPYRTLRRAAEHVHQGIFVAEAEKVVRQLIKTDLEVISFLLSYEWCEEIKDLIETKYGDKVKVFVGEEKLLDTIVGFSLHQCIMAVGKIPKPLNIEDVIQKQKRDKFFVALDGLTNADNLGVIVRNCVAFGVDALIVGETSSSPYLRRAIRQSMAAVFELPVVHTDNLAQTLSIISTRNGFRTIAADAHINDIQIENADFSGNICIVFGSEGTGIRINVLDECKEKVTIPVSTKVDSMNVASASAVFLYEAEKKRIP